MLSKNTLATVAGGMVLGAVVSLAAVALAQQTGTPLGQVGMPVSTRAAGGETLQLVSLGPDTFVTVKDNGDSQTVSVFKLEAKDMARLAHKAKFFYGTAP
jgi:hypothetical protein